MDKDITPEVVGEVSTIDDDGPVRLYVENDRLGRGLVFLNLDYATEEDNANVEADFEEQGWSDRGGAFVAVPLEGATARSLGELLIAASTTGVPGFRDIREAMSWASGRLSSALDSVDESDERVREAVEAAVGVLASALAERFATEFRLVERTS